MAVWLLSVVCLTSPDAYLGWESLLMVARAILDCMRAWHDDILVSKLVWHGGMF